MVVALGQGVARPGGLLGEPVRLDEVVVQGRVVAHDPSMQGGSDVEAQVAVVVHDVGDAPLPVHQPGRPVGAVAFLVDAPVPVVGRCGGGVQKHVVQPGVLPGGLVEMGVDADPSHGGSTSRPKRFHYIAKRRPGGVTGM